MPAATAQVDKPRLRLVETSTEITIDGELSESSWSSAAVTALVQQSPAPGEPTPFETEIFILKDASRLYFGIVSRDPDPSDIAVHTLERDGDLANDDSITVVLDTFGARRLAYVFQTNASGARTDGLLSPSGGLFYDFDAQWNVETRRVADGWTVEISIDMHSLQFSPGRAWALNVSRYVPRNQVSLAWAGHTLDSSVFDLLRAGTLAGTKGIRQGLGLSFEPYGVVRYESSADGIEEDAGFDFTYNITPELAGSFTYNTDFAEVEAQDVRFNLSRFPLFFPEKRDFFLRGSNRFDFSGSLVPFFSRRIGIVNGTVVPIDAGVKLVGQAGRWSIGALDVQTGDSDVAESTNLFAGRVAYDVNTNLRVGALATNGDPAGLIDNTFGGVDAAWNT